MTASVTAISPHPPHPIGWPVMLQRWESLTFLHWAYDPAVIRRLLPAQVQLDTYNGAAWIGLAPFLLTRLRPPFLPAAPWISRFPETNVRTYVTGPDGTPGVWFFTLEADRLLAVLAARALYRLPYRWSKMRVRDHRDWVEYESRRHRLFGQGSTHIQVRPGGPLQAGNFENFLTARFRLYTVAWQKLLHANIEHEPWPLQAAELQHLEDDLIVSSGVPKPQGDPIIHFSRSLDVRIGRIQIAPQICE